MIIVIVFNSWLHFFFTPIYFSIIHLITYFFFSAISNPLLNKKYQKENTQAIKIYNLMGNTDIVIAKAEMQKQKILFFYWYNFCCDMAEK